MQLIALLVSRAAPELKYAVSQSIINISQFLQICRVTGIITQFSRWLMVGAPLP